MIARRTFLAGGLAALAAAPTTARAQNPRQRPLVAIMFGSGAVASHDDWLSGFVSEMAGRGWVDGRNIDYLVRYAEASPERMDQIAGEFSAIHANVIVAQSIPATIAAVRATATIPIVSPHGGLDPVGLGWVDSINRPGRNVTGIMTAAPGMYAKLFELATELIPGAGRIGYLLGRDLSPIDIFESDAKQAAANYHLELTIVWADIVPGGLERAFHAIEEGNFDALVVPPSPFVTTPRSRIIEFAATHRLPAVYQSRDVTADGGLMSYGASLPALFRRGAYFVDLILRGAKPGDLPFEFPTVFALAVNLKTAKALGISFPERILVNATEIIE